MADIATLGLRVDANGISDGTRALRNMADQGAKTEDRMRKLGTVVKAVGATFGAYKLAQWAKDTLMLGARYETLGVAMEVVGKNAFKTAADMDRLQASLEKTGISMIEARSNLARMVSAELDLERATGLARLAQDAAVIANTNSSESFERLITGITTGQTRILRTLGIFVDFHDALERGAKEMGKTAQALTEQESAQIRANAVMESGTRIAGAYEAAMETAGKQLNSTVRYLEDAKVKVSEAFQPQFTAAVFAYANALKFAGEHAQAISTTLKVMLALFSARVVSEATTRLSMYNAALRQTALAQAAAATSAGTLTTATTATGRAMATAGTLAKGAWVAIGGLIGAAAIGALAINAVLDKYLARLVEANELTAEEQALWEKTQRIWADREAAAAAAAEKEKERLAAEQAAALAAAEKAKEAAKEARSLEIELGHQRALVGAFGETTEALDALNLEYEKRAALAKLAEEYTGADLARLTELTEAIYAQRQALADLEEQRRRTEAATLPLTTSMGLVSEVTGAEISLERELEARKKLLAATLAGRDAVRELAIAEAGAAAAAQALAAGMPETAERMREMAEAAARIGFAIQDAQNAAVETTDIVAESLRAISMQLGGLAGDVGQVVTQFFLMAEAAQKAAAAADNSFGAGEYFQAGGAAVAPAVAAMSFSGVANSIIGMFAAESRAREELRKAQEENTRALERVGKSIEEYGERLAGLSARQIQDFRDVLAFLQAGQAGANYTAAEPTRGTWEDTVRYFGMDPNAISGAQAAALIQLIQDMLAEAFKQVQEQVVPDFAARAATLAGDELEAARIRREAAAAREIAELEKLAAAGFITAEQLAEFSDIIGRELTQAARDAADAVEEAARQMAEATRALVEDLAVRGLRASGRSAEADTLALLLRQVEERRAAAYESPEVRELLEAVHELERIELAAQQAIGAVNDNLQLQLAALEDEASAMRKAFEKEDAALADQIELAQAELRVTEEMYSAQIKLAQEQLRTANEQLRAQERTVDELRNVVTNLAEYRQSLLTSNLSPLSPIQQLEAARAEFEKLATQAYGGSIEAGQALPGAARTYLEASRGVYASGAGYQADWVAVTEALAAAEDRFAGQLTVEEQMLSALQTQVTQLETQIAVAQAARDDAIAKAEAQIALMQAAREAARQQYEAQIAAIEEQMETARREADAQIRAIRAAAHEAAAHAQAQIDALLDILLGVLDLRRAFDLFARELIGRTDPGGGGQIPPPIVFDSAAFRTTENRLETLVTTSREQDKKLGASLTILQSGFASVSERLEAVEEAVGIVGTKITRSVEAIS